jgi:WD40 repeat protein
VGYRTGIPEFRDYVTLWQVRTRKKLCTLRGHTDTATFVGFLPDGKKALTASLDGNLRLYRVPGGKLIRTIRAFTHGITIAALSPDGTLALTKGRDLKTQTKLKLWRIIAGKLACEIDPGSESSITYLALAPNNRWALTAGRFHTSSKGSIVRLWDLTTEKPIRAWHQGDRWGAPVAFSPDGHLFLMAKDKNAGFMPVDTSLVLGQVASGKVVCPLEGKVKGMAIFVNGGRQVVGRGQSHTVKFWDIRTGKAVRSVAVYPGDRPPNPQMRGFDKGRGEPNPVEAFALSADGNRAAAAVGMNVLGEKHEWYWLAVKVWDLAQEQLLTEWPDPIGRSYNY